MVYCIYLLFNAPSLHALLVLYRVKNFVVTYIILSSHITIHMYLLSEMYEY